MVRPEPRTGDRQGVRTNERDLRKIPNYVELRGDHDYRIGYRVCPPGNPAAVAVALLARRLARLRVHLGARLSRTLYRGVLRVRGVSGLLRFVDGERSQIISRSLF